MARDAFRQDSSTEFCTDNQIVRHDLHVHLCDNPITLHNKLLVPGFLDPRRNEVLIPPIIVAAICFIISEPASVSEPRNATAIVMNLDRRRLIAP